ncbi:MAG: hypothetical protein V1799_21655 [bacterium]
MSEEKKEVDITKIEQKLNKRGLSLRETARQIGLSLPTILRFYKNTHIGKRSILKMKFWIDEEDKQKRQRPAQRRRRIPEIIRLAMKGYYKQSISPDVF